MARATLGLPLHSRGFIAALLCSLASLALLEARDVLSGTPAFGFLTWNLSLAWIPYLLSLLAAALDNRPWARWWALTPLAAGWLLFLPNAPYLVTDFVHLYPRPGVPLWADLALLSVFAATGWLLALLSLHAWKTLVSRHFGRAVGWSFTLVAAVLSGFGIYLGRFLRWNSWDVVAAPGQLAGSLVLFARDPAVNPRMLGVTLLFGALLFVSYLAMVLLKGSGTDGGAQRPERIADRRGVRETRSDASSP